VIYLAVTRRFHITTTDVSTSSIPRDAALSAPAYQAFLLLRTVLTVAPIVFGFDKFARACLADHGTGPRSDTTVPVRSDGPIT
jgi:hypothetical protein